MMNEPANPLVDVSASGDAVPNGDAAAAALFTRHERLFASNRFVYPVLSRRSGGLSVGVNLNPDKVCNFDCVYCQVDRREPGDTKFVGLPRLLEELESTLALASSGEIFGCAKFRDTPPAWRRLNDIAFSGDGEPTTHVNFAEIIDQCAALKRRLGLTAVKMVLITNASMFHRPGTRRGLEILDQNQGEIWAKLDAGTEEYFRLIDRAAVPFARVLENITDAARVRPLVIQSLFMRVRGEPPGPAEIEAYCGRLADIPRAGGKLSLVQVYTIARRPAESFVTPLTSAEVDAIAARVRQTTGLATACYYGVGGE